jgi:crotonobetainyl-CoA:carnitine CoA-transferase CaiB-like acyl-CoA transferase
LWWNSLQSLPSIPGQQTREILIELGMDQKKIAELEKEGIVKNWTKC